MLRYAQWFGLVCCGVLAAACAGENASSPPGGTGTPGAGGQGKAGSAGAVGGGGSSGALTTTGIAGQVLRSGGATGSGGAKPGGAGASSGAGAASGIGSAAGAGAAPGAGGRPSGAGGETGGGGLVGPGSYAADPPDHCLNQDWVQGCESGNATSECGGYCASINACLEATTKPSAKEVTFACPRFMLFSDAMLQAAIDDGNSGFNYAVVGHDSDVGGIDGDDPSACCQCYQLVFDYSAENQANEGASQTGPAAVPIPPPLIVQSFNTATNGPHDFDVYLAAGGFGANNACDGSTAMKNVSGQYLYTKYVEDSTNQGTVKPAQSYDAECKTSTRWVNTESISSEACQSKVAAACNTIASDSPSLTAETIRSCINSNKPETFYHLNWAVYAKRVECPAHLTEVTGCKLAPQGLPEVDRAVTTPDKAKTDSSFKTQAANGTHFSTTTMQDCCKPSCASQNWVGGKGLKTVGQYNSFYSCDKTGKPFTEPVKN